MVKKEVVEKIEPKVRTLDFKSLIVPFLVDVGSLRRPAPESPSWIWRSPTM